MTPSAHISIFVPKIQKIISFFAKKQRHYPLNSTKKNEPISFPEKISIISGAR